jgi:DNA-binding transcriptional LysR family regulator
MNWNDACLFVKVVEHGSFASAARALKMPKSSLSHRIAQLEGELGVRLIQRTSRSFSVTHVGREFHRHAAAMLIEAGAAEEAVRRRVSEPAGLVRVTSSPGISHAGLTGILAAFLADYPKVQIVQHTTNRNVDLVDEGFDLAVRAHEGALPDSALIQRKLGFSPRWLVATPTYLARAGVPADPSGLKTHVGLCMPAMAAEAGLGLRDREGAFARAQLDPRLCADDLLSLKAAALQHLGVAVLPAGLCRAEVADGSFTRVLPDWTAGGAQISILTPHRRGELPSVRALAEAIAQKLPKAMGLEPEPAAPLGRLTPAGRSAPVRRPEKPSNPPA